MAGKVDLIACQVCGQKSNVRPTVAFVGSLPISHFLVSGSVLDENGVTDLENALLKAWGKKPDRLEDMKALRARVRDLLGQHIDLIRPLLTEDKAQSVEMETWRRYSPAVFAGFVASLGGALSTEQLAAVGLDVSDVASRVKAMAAAAPVQAQVWKWLAYVWMMEEPNPRGQSLEEDLQAFVDPGFLIKGARQVYDAFADEINKQDLPATASYTAEAVRASLYAIGDAANPAGAQWAENFFALELAARKGPDRVSPYVLALQISEDRARKTITYENVWDAVARRLHFDRNEGISIDEHETHVENLNSVATKAGFPDLVHQVMTKGIDLRGLQILPLEEIINIVQEVFEQLSLDERRPSLFNSLADLLVREGRVDDLERVADAIHEGMGGGREAQARVEAWLGRYLKEMRRPNRFLARIGEQARDWEHEIDPDIRLNLWVERSNALRILGNYWAALDVALAALPLAEGRDLRDRLTLRRNIAILRRDTGAPDQALAEFYSLLDEGGARLGSDFALQTLDSIATTHAALGQLDEAITALTEAEKLAIGPLIGERARLRASRVSLLAATDRYQEAIDEIMSQEEASTNAYEIVVMAAAWAGIIMNAPEFLPEGAADNFESMMESLTKVIAEAEESGDIQSMLAGLRIAALLVQHLDEEAAAHSWLELYEANLKYEIPQFPDTLLWLAWHAYSRQEPELGHKFLTGVLPALTAQVGRVQDIAQAVMSTIQVRQALDRTAQKILFEPNTGADLHDARLIVELNRDVVGRARLAGGPRGDLALLKDGLTDEVLRVLAPTSGRLAVVEWAAAGDSKGRLLTTIDSTGDVQSQWLELPEVDEERLLPRLGARLMNWRSGKAGDPFDLAEWRQLESWLQSQLSAYLEQDEHIVFIEEEDTAGLPWHVAAAPRWTASYSVGWSALLALRRQEVAAPKILAAFAVPFHNDSKAVKSAFARSVALAGELANRQGWEFLSAVDGQADRDAFKSLMSRADVIKILCHGFAKKEETSLIVAANGATPPGDRLAIASERGERYRLSWRELQSLPAAPALVFCAACSSGLATIAGLGERLGLFNALIPHGTRSLVAPWWDAEAEPILPILDDAFARYVKGEDGLAAAVRNACLAAENHLPRWLAWTLAIEGDWR